MVDALREQIAHDHRDYVELSNLLDLAGVAWQRYGLSAAEIGAMDKYTRQLLRIKLWL